MPVVNIKTNPSAIYDQYVGRGSPFGNPFTHIPLNSGRAIKVASRQEAILRFREWLTNDVIVLRDWKKPTKEMIASLHGKTLACFCWPQACHASVLLELAELYAREAASRS
jgi:hypothetical protein